MKSSIFQIVVLGAFVFLAIVGVIIFAGGGGLGGGRDAAGPVVIWGTLPEAQMQDIIGEIAIDREDIFREVSYVEKDPKTYQSELVDALASGTGPDLFFLPQDEILRFENKIAPIAFRDLSESDFKVAYLEEGELYLTEAGILALPFFVDPLVMFYNRDLLSRAGIASAPRYWDEVLSVAEHVSEQNSSGIITTSGVALGEMRNIVHGKDIIATLLLQAGNPIVRRGQNGLEATLGKRIAEGPIPESEAALRSFTDFADPAKPVYSWNRALPEAQKMFGNGDLALYFGYASELEALRLLNPNLNLDIAGVPQIRDGRLTATFGKLTGLATARTSDNPRGAFLVATELTGKQASEFIVATIGYAPVRREVLGAKQDRAVLATLYASALTARGWLDPSPLSTREIFTRMVESVTSGRARLSEAVNNAGADLSALLTQ